jgi:Mrp family chromosome partitioning ATPase
VYVDQQDLPSLLANTANPNAAVPPDRYAAIQAQLARVPSVAARALARAGVRDLTPTQLLGESSVGADPNTGLLTFTVTDGSPSRAQRLSVAYAHAFIAYRVLLSRSPFASAGTQLGRRLSQLRAKKLSHTALFKSLVGSRKQLETFAALETANADVVSTPTSAAQVQPRKTRALAIGLPLGLLLGLAAALLLYVLDPHARTLGEAERSLELRSLGWIPTLPRRLRQRVTLLDARGSRVYRDAFAAVRTNVDLALRLHNGSDHGGAVLLVSSASTRGGGAKSAIAANLAVAFARAGLDVALVDLDLREPGVAKLFEMEPAVGAADVMLGRATAREALVRVALGPTGAPARGVEFAGTLRVLPAKPAPEAGDVVGTPRVGAMFEGLRGEADLVIVDVPPILEGSDAIAASVHADALVVIAQLGRDRRSALAEARHRLASTPAALLGCIGTGRGAPEAAYDGPRAEVVRPAAERSVT